MSKSSMPIKQGTVVFWNDPNDGYSSKFITVQSLMWFGRPLLRVTGTDGDALVCSLAQLVRGSRFFILELEDHEVAKDEPSLWYAGIQHNARSWIARDRGMEHRALHFGSLADALAIVADHDDRADVIIVHEVFPDGGRKPYLRIEPQ